MKSFVKNRAILSTSILTLLLGLFLLGPAQAEMIYAVRVNTLDGASYNNYYSNANFSVGNSSNQYCSQQSNGSSAYIFTNDTNDYTPIVLCDLGVVHTISSLDVSAYSVGGNSVKDIKVEFYDTPALSGTPVFTQEFSVAKTGKTTVELLDANNQPVSVQARYAKFTMTSNYGADRVGVGDVVFNVESFLKTPTSASMNSSEVATLNGYSVNYLYQMDASKQWCSNASDGTNGYFNGTNKNPVFTFNYDTPVTLSNVFIQTYSANGNSLKDFQLEFTDTNGKQFTYDYTMTDCNYGVQNVFSFPEIENVTSVKMTVTSNFRGIAPGGGDRIGVGGVYFTNLELELPTTPEKLDAPLSADTTLVRPTGAAFVTEGTERASNVALSYLYDGKKNAWYTYKNGNEKDFLNKGFSPVIDLTLPKGTYDSFSVWGYDSAGNQMTEFILELLNDGEVVYADDYQMGRRTASQYATFSLDGNYLFDTARITILDSGFGRFENSGGDRVGFAEIAFYQEPYYFANSQVDSSAENWTINGTNKKGVKFTDNGAQTAEFANPVAINSIGTFEVGEGKTLTISGAVSGSAKLEKTGAGTLKLSNASAYTGEIYVSEGRLDLLGSTAGSVTVGDAIFSPGNSPGAATVGGTFTLSSANSQLLMEIAGAGPSGNDSLVVTGDLQLNDGQIYLDMADACDLDPGERFTVVLHANNSSELAAQTAENNFIQKYVRSYYFTDLEYVQVNGQYAITGILNASAVPEPASWALLILGAFGLLYWRKRK